MTTLAPAGAVLLLSNQQWTYNVTITEPPASGQIRFNNATDSLVTKVWAHYTGSDAVDLKTILSSFVPGAGASLYVQNKVDSTQWDRWDVTAVVDKSTYLELSVVFVSGAGTIPAGLVVVRLYNPPDAPALPTRTQVSTQMLANLVQGAAIDGGRVAVRSFAINRAIVLTDELLAALALPPPVVTDASIL